MFDWINIIYATHREVHAMTTQIADLAADLATIKALLDEAAAELIGKITALEEALGNAGALPEEASIALDELRAQAQAMADIVPNDPVE